MTYFLDTSALVKRYRREEGTVTLDEIFSLPENEIIISSVSISEFGSSLNKHLRKKEITSEDLRQVIGRFYFDLRSQCISIADIQREVFFVANDLIFEYYLGCNDAIILASVLSLKRLNPVFVCADTKSGLLSAAQSLHISTLNPLSL
jgi:predicted nucleic acid-binding protein